MTTQTNQTNQSQGVQKLHDALNRQIAGWSVLYTKLHNFHWYVKGTHFFTLHEKFEEFYNEVTGHMDVVAERLLAIGGSPVATLKEHLNLSPIQEVEGSKTAEQMVQALVEDFTTMVEVLEEGKEAAEEMGDDSTADLMIGNQETLQKHIWMLNAFLGK